MIDKYNLSIEQNVFLAKKLLIDNIYHSAKLEGCNVTFPDTKTILEGVSVGNLKMDDVQTILNLKDAWKFVLNNVSDKLDLDYMLKVNSFVARNESLDWGVLRYGTVGITGTNYIPPIPNKDDVINNINNILDSKKSVTEKAIELFLWGSRTQLFWDGNKRSSLITANKFLISQGKGILTITEGNLVDFNRLLTQFYNTNDNSKVKEFIYEKCIHGLNIDLELKKKYLLEREQENH